MRIQLKEYIYEDERGIHVIFDVYGTESEPTAREVLLGSGNTTLHSSHTPEDVAKAVLEEAEAIAKKGYLNWTLHNHIASLLGS